ncbi:sterile alpha motif domain-containing protein 9-like [Physella acuta]|uniref:sterile alpha motif domain-containing protein 9-like n=1 Tax=Physella acuta TaxID=109671 RepID=UPI0027DE14AF|nr:sterile alpha motif domain-containing protein 9-like [Physella acuta]
MVSAKFCKQVTNDHRVPLQPINQDVINSKEREEINNASTSYDKMEKILDIIKHKSGKEPYSHLVTILREHSPHLVEKIEPTSSSSRPDLKAPDEDTSNLYAADDKEPVREYPRRFDSEVEVTLKYVKGRCFDDVSHNVRGKKTTPIKNYHIVDDLTGVTTMLEFIGSKLIPFVSACMNDTKNGTLYFGVCPEKDPKYRTGEVVGVVIDKDIVRREIENLLQTSFLESQVKYTKAVRHPKFVPVVSENSSIVSWVIEVDIVSSNVILSNEVIKTKLQLLKLFGKYKTQCKEYGIFRLSEKGTPFLLSELQRLEYDREISKIIKEREDDEKKAVNRTPKFLNKLNLLLTGGTDQGIILDDLYIFLMLSPVDSYMDQDFLNKKMSFIKDLEPEVVFDFDPNGFNQGIYHTLDTTQEEIFNVYTLDTFDNRKEDFNSLLERLQKDNYTQWVFCNGHDNMEEIDRRMWNKKRKLPFQEAIRAFADNHGKERVLLIMCLFSKNYEIMISACEEAITRLPNQWILLAENDVANLWQDKMSEDKLEKQELEYNCVLDMTWDEISMTVSQIKERTKKSDVFLPCSNGSMTPVPLKKLKEWHDIDILTAGDFLFEENTIKELEQKVELEFYRGEQVCWLNFWFPNQVLQRDIHIKLKELVENLLEGKTQEDYRVQYFTLWHQPGAGGTTSAMHVLWDLRAKYRCCRVLNITEETSEHLEEIWQFKEDTKARSPKPLLVLVDYVDDDEYIKFKGKLEELGRKNRRHYEESFDVFCTIIECKRSTSPPKESNKIGLLHNLTQRENVHDKVEIELLLIVSFLNVYDLTFKPIKVSWLDCFFKNRNAPNIKETITFPRDVKWEAKLNPGIKLLMNISNYSKHNNKPRKSLRIINKLVAREILNDMRFRTGKKSSEIMLELCDPKIYNQTGQNSNNFRYLINCVAKKREVEENLKKGKFSPFVTELIDEEGADVAVDVLIQLFEVSQDPFIAQLISRVYMEMKNWNKAKLYAQKATFLKPENSYLWDTYGRVFSSQLAEYNTENNAKISKVEEDIIKTIKIASEGVEIFQKAQEASENEMTTLEENNIAGYFGELRTILLVLNALKLHSAFREHSKLHMYLVELNYCPADLAFLQDYSFFLKGLASRARQGIRRLDEEYLQVKIGSGLTFQNMLDWSKKFYYLEQPKESSRHFLEPMMFYVLETTLFFLGNGPPLQDIVPQDHLEIMKEYNYKEKWTIPELRERLRMMTGVLSDDGEKVKTVMTTKDGNKFTLDILPAYPIHKRMMWNKRVYFYLGFSFSGPKAFGVSLEELGIIRNEAVGER